VKLEQEQITFLEPDWFSGRQPEVNLFSRQRLSLLEEAILKVYPCNIINTVFKDDKEHRIEGIFIRMKF